MTDQKPGLIAESVRWQIERVMVGSKVHEDEVKLTTLLWQGWEPFAVTSGGQFGYTYHFRRPLLIDGSLDGNDAH